MRIAYILPSLRNQGPIVVVKNITDYLVKWGHEPEIFYLDETSSKMTFKCPTRHIRMRTPIDFDRYDVIHSHCLRPDIYVFRWRKYIHRAKIVSTLHQDTYYLFRDQYNPIVARLFTACWCYIQSKFNGVISISNLLKASYQKRIKTRITTIHNGCVMKIDGKTDGRIAEILTKVKSTNKLLGTYAFVVHCKGLAQVIQVLPLLQDYAFAVIGEGPEINMLKEQAQTLGVADRVYFFPYQEFPCNYLHYFDIYMMPYIPKDSEWPWWKQPWVERPSFVPIFQFSMKYSMRMKFVSSPLTIPILCNKQSTQLISIGKNWGKPLTSRQTMSSLHRKWRKITKNTTITCCITRINNIL